ADLPPQREALEEIRTGPADQASLREGGHPPGDRLPHSDPHLRLGLSDVSRSRSSWLGEAVGPCRHTDDPPPLRPLGRDLAGGAGTAACPAPRAPAADGWPLQGEWRRRGRDQSLKTSWRFAAVTTRSPHSKRRSASAE